jgi:membrane protein DedA with SNARE-associated domain
MVPIDLLVVAFVGIVLGVSVLSYLLGRITGKRAERRRWKRRIAGEVRELGRTRAMIHRALENGGRQ